MSPMAISSHSYAPQTNRAPVKTAAAVKAWAPVKMSSSVRNIGNRELQSDTQGQGLAD